MKVIVLTKTTEYRKETIEILGVFKNRKLAKQFAKPIIKEDIENERFKTRMPRWDGDTAQYHWDDVSYRMDLEEFEVQSKIPEETKQEGV